jgi:hypothetical protein
MIAIGYVAGILAVTSRRSPVATASLAAGTISGVAAGLVIRELLLAMGDIGQIGFVIVPAIGFLFAIPPGLAAAWLVPETAGSRELRAARIRQGALAGALAGAGCGVVLTYVDVVAVFMMLAGPLAGALAGAAGGAFAADHPRIPRPDGSRAAGLFVAFSTRQVARQVTGK